MTNFSPDDLHGYIAEHSAELLDLIKTLCRIPAPSNDEGARAAFLRDWFLTRCGSEEADVIVDGALNVIYRLNYRADEDVSIFMAHTDTVFPDLTPFEPEEREGRLYCPGVGDDTTNLAMLMLSARYVATRKVPSDCGVLFVGNAGEEGLGNLKGCRKLMEDHAGRVRQVVSFDGRLGNLTNKAVGSRRYRVAVSGQGGHSWNDFGNSNAIQILSEIIVDLYKIAPPAAPDGPTTLNVGKISGGTSVNSIAETSEMLFEYRSVTQRGLDIMERKFREILERRRGEAEKIEVELIGERPSAGKLDPTAQETLERKAFEVIQSVTGKAPKVRAASTDCNLPLSLGIPAVALGGYRGSGAHTRGEFIDLSSLSEGFEVVLRLILRCMEA
ncbi:MAG: M20/M25/M40 family metallo-hydrolase [Synergistaceae bacterium]|jgi:acetylornithine deacetylase/succinyl-diaminopimelate desuccinylase-like protein|nr:M20/M25/M40 family metallo-hydrolase [Synergistaceae bacterium]